VNPNAPPGVPRKKFRTSINTHPMQSRTSRKAPYAARTKISNSAWDQPKVVNGKVFTKPDYNSLEDPHLNEYFARKLGALPKLTDKKKKVCDDKTIFYLLTIDVIKVFVNAMHSG